MDAYHVFYQSKEDGEFESINYLIQSLSAKLWKKNQGNIHLYCNSKFLESIKKWNIDKLYDTINTECLDTIPFRDCIEKYWSFCKIQAAKDISQYKSEFVILDTDFWIQEPIFIDNNFQIIGYHSEMKSDNPKNPYLSPETFLSTSDTKLFDWSINPINCAFLYLNSKDLINEWYKWVLKVIQINKHKEKRDVSADTIFIEQRLLPSIAYSIGMKVGTLIPNIYYPHIPSDNDGSEWSPKIGFDDENKYLTWNIKHVWGLKNMYDDPSIRNIVIDIAMDSLEYYFPNYESEYVELFEKVKSLQTLSIE